MKQIDDADLINNLKATILGFWPNRKKDVFPGPMPISLNRSKLPVLLRYPYVISLKTDGIRYFMMCHNKKTYLIDRSFHFYEIDMAFEDSIYGSCSDDCGLLLDGEILDGNYYAHDCICIFSRGECKQQPLTERYSSLKLAVSLCNNDKSEYKIVAKRFYSFAEFTIDIMKKSEFKIDGLIFTPVNLEIGNETQDTLFKLKHTHTVDLKFIEDSDCYDGYVTLIDTPLKYATTLKANRAFCEMLAKNCPNFKSGDIIECEYNKRYKSFDPIKIRYDKQHPNSRKTVEMTIIDSHENITYEEIVNLIKKTSARNIRQLV